MNWIELNNKPRTGGGGKGGGQKISKKASRIIWTAPKDLIKRFKSTFDALAVTTYFSRREKESRMNSIFFAEVK